MILGIAGSLYAETDYIANERIDNIRKATTKEKDRIIDLNVKNTATIGGNASVAGTLAVTGNTTLSGALDVDSVTVDAGAGIDTQAAGILKVGESTATSVEIADTGVNTDIGGTMTVNGNTEISGELGVDNHVRFVNTNAVWKTVTMGQYYGLVARPRDIGTVTNGQSLGGLGYFYLCNAAAAVTCTVDNASATGHVFNVINTGTETITFADSGNLKLSGNAVLGQYDTLSLYAADTNVWVEMGQQDN